MEADFTPTYSGTRMVPIAAAATAGYTPVPTTRQNNSTSPDTGASCVLPPGSAPPPPYEEVAGLEHGRLTSGKEDLVGTGIRMSHLWNGTLIISFISGSSKYVHDSAEFGHH